MHLPFTKFGLPQLVIYPLIVLGLMVAVFMILKPSWIRIPVEILLFLVLVWMLSFFRNPARSIAADETVLFSPADGTVTDITQADDSALGPGALRIGIFLSIFSVHINRAPCSVHIESANYKKGQYKNAMLPESSRVNESNDILMVRLSEPKDKLLVRQISGAIARHIVSEARAGNEYRQGDPFGMIKFGSRTEIYLPIAHEQSAGESQAENDLSYGNNKKFQVMVKIGDKVRAGLTPLIRYHI